MLTHVLFGSQRDEFVDFNERPVSTSPPLPKKINACPEPLRAFPPYSKATLQSNEQNLNFPKRFLHAPHALVCVCAHPRNANDVKYAPSPAFLRRRIEAGGRNRQQDGQALSTPANKTLFSHHAHHTTHYTQHAHLAVMERKSAAGGSGSGVGSRAGGAAGGGAGEHKMLVEWHPFLPDYFVAGGDELQLYQVHRQRQEYRGLGGGFANGGLPPPR